MIVYIFGNSDLREDSLPLKILPQLKIKFPEINFETKDPNEEWETPDEFILIDSVHGLRRPKIFYSLKDFSPAPNITMHDFDALANLRLLEKLGKIKKIKIIGLPPDLNEKDALNFISSALSS